MVYVTYRDILCYIYIYIYNLIITRCLTNSLFVRQTKCFYVKQRSVQVCHQTLGEKNNPTEENMKTNHAPMVHLKGSWLICPKSGKSTMSLDSLVLLNTVGRGTLDETCEERCRLANLLFSHRLNQGGGFIDPRMELHIYIYIYI